MKKLFAIIVALALTAALCISSFAGLDSLYINANTLDGSNIAGEAGKSKVTIEKGDKLFILGWMAKQGTTLEKIYWTLDGVEKECSDVYRDRTEIAANEAYANAGWVADEFVHAGFGKDDGYMEMLGVDSLENGTYSVAIVVATVKQTHPLPREGSIYTQGQSLTTPLPWEGAGVGLICLRRISCGCLTALLPRPTLTRCLSSSLAVNP